VVKIWMIKEVDWFITNILINHIQLIKWNNIIYYSKSRLLPWREGNDS